MNTNKEITTEAKKYLEGTDLGYVMHMVSQIFTIREFDFDNENEIKKNVFIKIKNPAAFKTWWEFYDGDTLICVIKFEAQDPNGRLNYAWLEWINDFNGDNFLRIYEWEWGMPEEIDEMINESEDYVDEDAELEKYLRYQ